MDTVILIQLDSNNIPDVPAWGKAVLLHGIDSAGVATPLTGTGSLADNILEPVLLYGLDSNGLPVPVSV